MTAGAGARRHRAHPVTNSNGENGHPARRVHLHRGVVDALPLFGYLSYGAPTQLVARGEQLLAAGLGASAKSQPLLGRHGRRRQRRLRLRRHPERRRAPSLASWNSSRVIYGLRGWVPTDQIQLLRDNNGDKLLATGEAIVIESPGVDPKTQSPSLTFDASDRPGGGYLRNVAGPSRPWPSTIATATAPSAAPTRWWRSSPWPAPPTRSARRPSTLPAGWPTSTTTRPGACCAPPGIAAATATSTTPSAARPRSLRWRPSRHPPASAWRSTPLGASRCSCTAIRRAPRSLGRRRLRRRRRDALDRGLRRHGGDERQPDRARPERRQHPGRLQRGRGSFDLLEAVDLGAGGAPIALTEIASGHVMLLSAGGVLLGPIR